MKYHFRALLILVCIPIAAFSQSEAPYQVEYKGALKNLMHKGDLSAKADVRDYQKKEHFYALGAVENLKGEILIMDSKAYVSSVQDKELSISSSFEYKAALFVYCSVEKWNSFDIPDSITTYEELESFVEQKAKNEGVNTDEPFPLRLSGTAQSFDWHVIDWKDGDTEHSHQKHIESGLHGTKTNQEVEILGFYSNSHHAIFTHHSTNMHLHVKTSDDQLSGHLDGLVLGKGMTLMLPAN